MIAAALPAGFFWCLAGTVIGGGLALFIVSRLLAGRSLRKRVAALGADEDGSTIVEFPFALITLVVVAVFTWQFGFMLAGYLVIDYSAFAAARSAIVVIPQTIEGDDNQAHNKIPNVSLDGFAKGNTIEGAAEFACFSVSGRYNGPGDFSLYVPFFETVVAVPGGDKLSELMDQAKFLARMAYAVRNTKARVVSTSEGVTTFSGGEAITIEVQHDFNLRVPIAARFLGRLKTPEGYVTTITSYATLLNEGYTGVVPADAPAGSTP